ncbi:BREX-1 system adenine-specific DNA-methyltransferase PglX [Clostridium estertheticum]|uniref:BREX-1 system adenine-specific DNA-methyltransferase PglX n=1 Tax=Clostridium estertheticum TaxID=238834 RepID=UPI001C0BA7EE|nr:BREX-1 system adenine-specific DNA-methyltransferase PglX [Clostridium estertheticum]MBU3200604.1 BREX-1 system adenine-specific DNA-methyltransferase PglX [Clostridium estertheticum]MCB2354380.1 BREX-1 system adenine-specific DNA-methyltransferase PglX [Clostridium estertheticum]WAG42501.1 BREX-1 system adenine-specific DNA-methyltransferase PglX [Clostridium estertheticum]WAG64935.1 BREX-1 system adenine-specific DNA-methyltransferase PglX [Clostridium estertheticum]
MDKSKIKSFAIWARRKLISSVSERANRIGVSETKIEEALVVQGGFKLEGNDEIFKLSKEHRDKLVNQVNVKGFSQVMEEAAYTWFNRFMGLRYMEVNDYLPSGIRVLSSIVTGKTEPDVLTRVPDIIEELRLKPDYIYELLDSGKSEDREEAYKHILVKQCNELGKIIPQMFEKISDYTELLLPDNLLEEGSVIRRIVEDIKEDDWKEEVEIIGWMYQYYISEKKDEVFAALNKNVKITKENIPAATQLFTPKWIVKYMVENSLGRLWLEGHPNEELQKEWKYYLEEAQQEPEVEEELKKIREEHSKLKPEDIKILDPCMGSGHILVYAFDVLYEIYKVAGYSEREIPRLILQNNLYGLDIDDRAAQLAAFALIMKARHYNRRLFREMEREGLELNLCSIQESNSISISEFNNDVKKEDIINYFIESKDNELMNKLKKEDIEYLLDVFIDAKEYGSILEIKVMDFDTFEKRLVEIKAFEQAYSEAGIEFPIEFPLQIDVFSAKIRNIVLERIPVLVKQARIMSKKYEICVTNPPYMGLKGFSTQLSNHLKNKYPNSKNDLFAVFMEVKFCKRKGYFGIINQHSWMFLSSYEKLREHLLNNKTIVNMLHLGARTFDEIGGEVVQSTTFVLRNSLSNKNNGYYIRLLDLNSSRLKQQAVENELEKYKFEFQQQNFGEIPGMPIAYWISSKVIEIIKSNKLMGQVAKIKVGLQTGDNEKFLRKWYEVDLRKIGTIRDSEVNFEKIKWYPYNKGGEQRKWYGNNEYIVNWENDGYEIKNFKDKSGKLRSRPQNTDYYFKKSITWSDISGRTFAGRYCQNGFIFDVKGSSGFVDEEKYNYILGLLNSKIVPIYIDILNPTSTTQVGDIKRIPVIIENIELISIDKINLRVEDCIKISKNEWDIFETSWDFIGHPLMKLLCKGEQYSLNTIFNIWETECEVAFEQLKHNEEELNRIFIDIYGLQDELKPEVVDKDVTIRKADRERDIKSFISYAVGCMVGRYSIDIEGLVYAGGEFKDKWNLEEKKVRKIERDEEGNIISDSWVDATFIPDLDNVIPITEDEYFEDDIVSRFIEFVRIVYSAKNIEENLDFIADSIGRKPSETARQTIRRYFIKDFYKDHLKVYKKRPIYWMFDSGKNDGFKALVYMHRYNEQTIAKVRTDYIHTLQRKYEAEVQRQQSIVDSEGYTVKDRTVAKKKIDRIVKQIEECKEYDQVVAHLANDKISIDLDDGVKVNYEKFQGVKFINAKDKEVKMDLLANI